MGKQNKNEKKRKQTLVVIAVAGFMWSPLHFHNLRTTCFHKIVRRANVFKTLRRRLVYPSPLWKYFVPLVYFELSFYHFPYWQPTFLLVILDNFFTFGWRSFNRVHYWIRTLLLAGQTETINELDLSFSEYVFIMYTDKE